LAQTAKERKAVRLRRLAESERVFARRGMLAIVEIGHVIRGDIWRDGGEWGKAQIDYQEALDYLNPGFPDIAWKALYGLAQLALARNEAEKALKYLREAVGLIAQVRTGVSVERESNSFFGARRDVFDLLVRTAIATNHYDDALFAIAAAKARSFLQQLAIDANSVRTQKDTAEVLAAQKKEQELRLELLKRRAELTLADAPPSHPRKDTYGTGAVPSLRLKALNKKTRAYNRLVTQLELTRRGFGGDMVPEKFSVDAFREMANSRRGGEWTALSFYVLSAKEVCVVYLDSKELYAELITLDEEAQFALALATDTNEGRRELMYRGSMHGFPVEQSVDWLGVVSDALLPPSIRERVNKRMNGATLVVSPHGLLHQLPFSLLKVGTGVVLDRFRLVYAPSLQSLIELDKRGRRAVKKLLVCGLDDFEGRAAPLPNAKREVETVRATRSVRADTLWGAKASAATLMGWNASGALAQYDALHFVTHIVLYPKTRQLEGVPHLAGIRLADGDLTVLDIARMELNAQYVFLSGCSSGLGEGGEGDEIVGLARAFFHAGARAVVASLWAVRDDATVTIAQLMYEKLWASRRRRDSEMPLLAWALREAQLEMRAQGYPAYDWAGFIVMGCG
jgi:hypothetical protein